MAPHRAGGGEAGHIGRGDRPIGVGNPLGRDALPENPVRPCLVSDHQRGEDHRGPGHDLQGVRRGRRVVNRQAPAGIQRRGNEIRVQAPNSSATTAATTAAVQAKAHPSPPRLQTSMTADSWAITARPRTTHVQSLPCASCVQIPNTATTAVTGSASQRREPHGVVTHRPFGLQPTNTAPWNANNPAVASPPSRVYGLSTSVTDRSICLSASTGSPRTRAANATPQRTAGIHDPMAMPTSAHDRHRGSSILPRHSIAHDPDDHADQDRQQRQVET